MSAPCRIAFAGAGAIARAHAYALAALPYYYAGVPERVRVAVASRTRDKAAAFAARFGFSEAVELDELWRREDIDTLFIAGPNESHCGQLCAALRMPGIRRIYLEKPVCISAAEEGRIEQAAVPDGVAVQTGFQYLQMPAARRALKMWRRGEFGDPVHFEARYLHDGYLDRAYRDARRSRLQPTPAGGALSDLGSHAFSLLAAFLGTDLEVVAARQSGRFDDVPEDSDLCTSALLEHRGSGAAGSVVASRVSAGAAESLDLEIRGTLGAFRFSGDRPDVLESAVRLSRTWNATPCGGEYLPASAFPGANTTGGWLRSLVHAHYLFFGGADADAFIPDLRHGLAVQRLLRATAVRLGRPADARI